MIIVAKLRDFDLKKTKKPVIFLAVITVLLILSLSIVLHWKMPTCVTTFYSYFHYRIRHRLPFYCAILIFALIMVIYEKLIFVLWKLSIWAGTLGLVICRRLKPRGLASAIAIVLFIIIWLCIKNTGFLRPVTIGMR